MPDTLTHHAQELYQLPQWRYDDLRRAGYSPNPAAMLAKRFAVDLHEACGLLERGATVEQALAILR